MNNTEFKTQICTTREQSKQLLALGLKPETADMCYNGFFESLPLEINRNDAIKDEEYIPAWSLSRLLDMMPKEIPTPDHGLMPCHIELVMLSSGCFLSLKRWTSDCLFGTGVKGNPFDACIEAMEWSIQKKCFNKKYLL